MLYQNGFKFFLFVTSLSFSIFAKDEKTVQSPDLIKNVSSTKPSNLEKNKIDVDLLLNRMDDLFRKEHSIAVAKMIIESPKRNDDTTMSFKMWSKGTKFALIEILEPKKSKGISTLKRDGAIWNFFPNIGKQMKVPASMMMGSWMGSDFTNDDLVRESSYKKDFNTKAEEDGSYYLLTLTPKKETISLWDKILMKIKKDGLFPEEYRFFNEKGENVRTLFFSEIKDFSGVKLPSKLKMMSHVSKEEKEEKSTTFIYESMDFKTPLEQSFFSFQQLKAKNK